MNSAGIDLNVKDAALLCLKHGVPAFDRKLDKPLVTLEPVLSGQTLYRYVYTSGACYPEIERRDITRYRNVAVTRKHAAAGIGHSVCAGGQQQ